ncbi:hypothetical protein SteCoe_2017 [Stentor coeruleus]|uniref:Cyclic nucleotide-binding domain-containing protein n=1 Tax=Stentor coeruleus TaxID=5963 RepID=A0A1R2D0A2_9CILI|nr:hypothetical protein SteCoe_2017 [Stentor coeruleus]
MSVDSKQAAIKYLSIPPEARTLEDVNAIYELTKHVEFFYKTLQDDGKIHRACCKLMTYEQFNPGDTIVTYGDVGDKFYIILTGELSVIVPIFTDTQDQINKEMKEVRILSDGNSFGELALIRGGLRAATIKAKTLSTLVVLKKNDFKKTLSYITEKKINEKVEALKKIPLFSTISHLELQKLSYYFSEVKYYKGQIVYREKTPSDTLYFIKSGDFKLTKAEYDHHEPYGLKIPNINNNRIKTQRTLTKKATDLQIVIKGDNESLGYEEMVEKDIFYKTTCTCISTVGVVYSISFTHFRQRIRNPYCWKIINEKIKIDKINYTERIRNLQSVENLKEEFMFKKPKYEPFCMTQKSEVLRKYSPVRDILENNILLAPTIRNVETCKNLVYKLRFGSIDKTIPKPKRQTHSIIGSFITRSSMHSSDLRHAL